MKAVVLMVALSCFVSFAWAMKRFFTKPDGKTSGMQAIYMLGTVFSLLHLGLIFFLYRFSPWTTLGGLALYAASLALFWWAVQINRSAPLSFAFSRDQPQHLVVAGPYRHVRHPFYTAYTLTWLAGAVVIPAPWLLLSVLVMFYFYWQAARQEEIKFGASEFAEAYRDYQGRTGMFAPRLF